MNKRFFQILFLVLCISQSISAMAPDESVFGRRDTYYKTLKKFTRKGTGLALAYLDTNFIWYATYKSEDFRRDFSEYYHRLYPEGQDGLAQTLAAPWMEPSGNLEFFITIFSPAKELEELGGKQSLWNLTLHVGQEAYKPIEIKPMEAGPFEFKFFPYLEKWYRAYRVVFPGNVRIAAGDPFSLHLTSVAGKSELKF